MILTFSFKTFNHINQIVTSQQGTALTILALLKGTDAEIGSAWVQQHVKTFAEGFLSQVTFRDWSADQSKKHYQGLQLDEFFTLPRHAWTGSWRWNILLYIISSIIIILLSLSYYTGCPKKTHFQNCHELASSDQLPATTLMLIIRRQFLAILKVRFFGTPCII